MFDVPPCGIKAPFYDNDKRKYRLHRDYHSRCSLVLKVREFFEKRVIVFSLTRESDVQSNYVLLETKFVRRLARQYHLLKYSSYNITKCSVPGLLELSSAFSEARQEVSPIRQITFVMGITFVSNVRVTLKGRTVWYRKSLRNDIGSD